MTGVECPGKPPRFELSSDSKREILMSLVRDEEYIQERAKELQQTEGSSAWGCKHCTYINVTAKKRCGACSKPRGSTPAA
jgi:rubrerythrin